MASPARAPHENTGSSARTPEQELLIACARSSMDEQTIALAHARINSGLNWPTLMKQAERHGVLQLLAANLNHHFTGVVPADTRDDILKTLAATTLRCEHRLRHLTEILTALEDRGITALTFKGPVFSAEFYGDPALRWSQDIDLLIRPDEVPRARRILVSLAFQPQFDLTDRQEQALIHYRSSHAFFKEPEQILVDLHWAPQNPYLALIDTTEARARCRTVHVQNRDFTTFSLEDYVLMLSSHGLQHNWERLSYATDLAEVLRSAPEVDWDAVYRMAAAKGRNRILFLALLLARDILGAPLPAGTEEKARAYPGAAVLADGTRSELLANEIRSPSRRRGLWLKVRALERFKDKLGLLPSQVLRPTGLECERLTVPRPLFFLYRPYRLLRLSLKYTPGFPRAKRRSPPRSGPPS